MGKGRIKLQYLQPYVSNELFCNINNKSPKLFTPHTKFLIENSFYCFTGDGDSTISASRGGRQWRKEDDWRWGFKRRSSHICSSCFS